MLGAKPAAVWGTGSSGGTMIDAKLRPLMDPALNSAGWRLARAGIRADHITLLGLAFGLLSAAMLAINLPGGLAMLPLIDRKSTRLNSSH